MLVAAGLDWTVSKRRLWAEADNTAIQVPGYFGLTRDKDNHVLSIVGSKYKPVENTDAMDFFNRFVSAGEMQMETAGSLHNGQYIWGLAKIEQDFGSWFRRCYRRLLASDVSAHFRVVDGFPVYPGSRGVLEHPQHGARQQPQG